MSSRGITHVKPNELSGGKAQAPIQSDSAVAGGFKAGIMHLASPGNFNAPGVGKQTVSRTSGWGKGFKKP